MYDKLYYWVMGVCGERTDNVTNEFPYTMHKYIYNNIIHKKRGPKG